MIPVTTKDNVGDGENESGVQEIVANQTYSNAVQHHADKPSFHNGTGMNSSKVIEKNTGSRSRQNYFEYFGGRR